MLKQKNKASKDSDCFASNEVRLSLGQWVITIIVVLIFFAVIPAIWSGIDGFGPTEENDFRNPYDWGYDYWMYGRSLADTYAVGKIPIIGDSVIWGAYADKDQTLPANLNRLAKKNLFANCAIDGLHPVVMNGLLENYGKVIKNKPVIINLNLLWMTSKKQDLSVNEPISFNHQNLAPQFTLACNKPEIAVAAGVVADRASKFFLFSNHLKLICIDNMKLDDWLCDNPYVNPFAKIKEKTAEQVNKQKEHKPQSWVEKGIQTQDFKWVMPKDSYQWASFKQVLKLLEARGNDVFVIFGTFNHHMLTEQSAAKYRIIRGEIVTWLSENNVKFYSAGDLPSELFADGSHPLANGYTIIAEKLYNDEAFQSWLENLDRK